MIIKKKNKIVGLTNIIFGVLGCITWALCVSCMTIEEKTPLYLSYEQETACRIFVLIMAIPLFFTFIINLIYIFRNWHNKKSMFMNILTIASIIASIVLMFIFEAFSYLYIISLVALWGILILIFNKKEDEVKKHRILFGILIINAISFIVSFTGFLFIKSDFEIKYANNEKNLLKSIMQLSSSSSDIPIKVQKNGKWGYIDYNGNTVIDFKYDNCSEFVEVENLNTNKKYCITLVSFGDELRLITNTDKQIVSYKNKKYERNLNYFPSVLKDTLEDNAESLNIDMEINDYNRRPYYEQERKYNSTANWDYSSNNNVLSFDIPNKARKKIELTYNTKTKSVTYYGKKISIDGELYIYQDDSYEDGDYYIDTYQNGYIPIYNFEKELFGWIDLKGQTHYIHGKIQILDFSDKYIAVKDYSIDGDLNTYVMDYQGNRVSDFYQEITVLNDGYIVKKQNGKNVYLDENFREISQEYDIVDGCRVNDGILIVSNLSNKNGLKNLRFDLININNGQVIGQNFEYISGMNDDKYKANYYDNLTNAQFKEILCSVDCDYLNTNLYEEYCRQIIVPQYNEKN